MPITHFNETPVGEKLRVFSLYTDLEASRRAKFVAGTIIKLAGRPGQFVSEMWKLDALTASEPIRRMFTHDAAMADVLIVAVSSLDHRPEELIGLMDSVAVLKADRSMSGLLIGLLGSDENLSRELDWTVKQLIACAQKADRDFIWHWMGQDALSESDWLNEYVEMLMRRKWLLREQMVLKEAAAAVG